MPDETAALQKNNRSEKHDEEAERQIEDIAENGTAALASPEIRSDPGRDEHFEEAGRFIIEKNKASIGLLQRVFKIGFNRAGRLMDQLCKAGVVGEAQGSKPREVLISDEASLDAIVARLRG